MNTFGQLFRVTTFGESHGGGVGCVIDGCPPRIAITAEEIEAELQRRATGQSALTSARKEADKVEILSGINNGQTLGTPICLLVRNADARPQDYAALKDTFRPSHADFTYERKYGIRAESGGGRASARETTARVMAGVVAKKILQASKIEILAYVSRVKDIAAGVDPMQLTFAQIEANAMRCPDLQAAERMIALVTEMKEQGNSVGGVVSAVVQNCPIGLGDPVFDKLEATLAHALMSLPAAKGFEIGSGFAGTYLTGREHNDAFYARPDGSIGTRTNRSGGIQGGISNGEPLLINVAFKPTSTILTPQQSVDRSGKAVEFTAQGRHDPCVLPRAVPIVEAMIALVLVDHLLRDKAQNS